MKYLIFYLLALGALTATGAQALKLTSNDIHEGQKMSSTFEFNGSNCHGGNVSPQLAWHDVPKGTGSFAITAYDPDAATGSGWWHWIVVNISSKTTYLKRGFRVTVKSIGANRIRNDFSLRQFSGACSPKGGGMHRYQFTLWALPGKLKFPIGSTPTMIGFLIKSAALDKAVLTATYVR